MKSDVITIESNGQGIEEALATTEAVANYKNLSHKDSLKLRLLTEEMMGLIQGLTGETRSEFYIETEEDQFKLHMRTQTFMDSTKRKNLLDATTSGKNAAAVGFIGTYMNPPLNTQMEMSQIIFLLVLSAVQILARCLPHLGR